MDVFPAGAITDSATVSNLQNQDEVATDKVQHVPGTLSAAQAELRAKDHLIASLSEECNVYQSLCSALDGKVGKKEGEIVNSMAKLARLNAQVSSLTKRNGEYKADLATMREVTQSQGEIIQQLRGGARDSGNADGSSLREKEGERQADTIRSLLERNLHLETLLSSIQETLAQRDATIAHLSDRRAKQEAQVLTLSQDREKLRQFCASLEQTIAEDEEAMARLRITIAKEKVAAEEWKTLFTLSRAQPHIHGAANISTVGIFEAQNRKIAELQEKLSECHMQLVASHNGTIFMPRELLLLNGGSDSAPI
ncbi:hypothetical protein EST38_g6280 [Candolleomyces aberdarensis]|uniref:Uncharacterized protein n=1 Tax=Candolleomyces aberdarensis TaxID=2316362 RepID=A0A4Q2DIG6_9AGAR|nr:hypothetical protein EST38_g6280 [Candolleomyces aberdarensis]